MKKLILGCALALSSMTMPQAFAENFCCPTQYDPCCCGGVDFNGFYVGGNVGVFSHTAHRNDFDSFLVIGTGPSGFSSIGTTVTAGVQVGYDWQCCNRLLGLVVDWNWANPENEHRFATSTARIENEIEWFTTIRARAGLTVCDALVYVTLGAAVAKFENEWRSSTAGINFRDHRTRWGWVGGVGTEFIVWCNFSLGLEVLYMHFSHHSRTFTAAGLGTFRFNHSDSAWVGRVLLNYRFGDLCGCFGGFGG